MNTLPSHAFLGNHTATPFAKKEAVGYYKEETMQIYVPHNKKTYDLFDSDKIKKFTESDKTNLSMKISHDIQSKV